PHRAPAGRARRGQFARHREPIEWRWPALCLDWRQSRSRSLRSSRSYSSNVSQADVGQLTGQSKKLLAVESGNAQKAHVLLSIVFTARRDDFIGRISPQNATNGYRLRLATMRGTMPVSASK